MCVQYMPTIGDMYTKDIEVAGAPRHIEIDDTAGQVKIRAPAAWRPPHTPARARASDTHAAPGDPRPAPHACRRHTQT